MKWIKKAYKRYLIDAMSSMALGLFSSLIIGSILEQLAKIPGLSILSMFSEVLSARSGVIGAAIGVAIGYGLKVAPLALFSSAATGALGYVQGGPVCAFLAAVVGADLGNLVAGRTKVDIIVVPMVTIISGGLIAIWTAPGINFAVAKLQDFLEMATVLQPIPMGIIISVVFGLALTAPISSAALASAIFTVAEGEAPGLGLMLAAGAATVGCCCQMVGFAVSSYRENRVAGLISQGIGTSMLQISNIMKNPLILIPPTLASAILGPLSTTVFQMKNLGLAAGMGTSGLIGQFGTWTVMAGEGMLGVILKILALHIVLPAGLAILFSELMRRRGLIKEGDMKLEL